MFFDNPDLPFTRSEIALPLLYAGQVTGALDVQSIESNAFDKDDVEALSMLADQISIAINNTLTLEEARKAQAESQKRVGESTLETWRVLQPQSSGFGYQLIESSLHQMEYPLDENQIQEVISNNEPILSNLDEEASNLTIPIRLRGQVIGVMNLRSRDNYLLTQEDVDIAEAVTERLSLAIETATLLRASQHSADIERITTEISSRVNSSTRFETILQTTAQELSHALGGSDVVIQIEPTVVAFGAEEQ